MREKLIAIMNSYILNKYFKFHMQVKKIINLLKEHKSSKSKSFYLKNPYQKITKKIFKNFY